jgi:hypothetical protein
MSLKLEISTPPERKDWMSGELIVDGNVRGVLWMPEVEWLRIADRFTDAGVAIVEKAEAVHAHVTSGE